jgi:hypothetical protein
MTGIKGKSGGARKGAGRKPKEPTRTIAFRIPAKHYDGLKTACKEAIAEYIKKADKRTGTKGERGK